MSKIWFVNLILAVITALALLLVFGARPYIILNMLKKIETGRLTVYENGNLIVDVKGKHKGQHGVIDVANIKEFLTRAENGEVAIGEMYMEGRWKSPDIIALVACFIDNQDVLIPNKPSRLSKDFETDTENIHEHYDAGNDFYMSFLKDSTHAYSCGIWKSQDDNLESAQRNKLDTIVTKLHVQKGDRILDIGCGWGYVGDYIAKKTGQVIDGISISKEQLKFIASNIQTVRGLHMHYMNLPASPTYDKVYSIEMFEHVRCVNYVDFFNKVYGCMKPNGRFVLQTITYNIPRNQKCDVQNISFVNKHVFENGQIAMRDWVISAASKAGFKTTHIEVYGGHHYYKTLKAWRDNLISEIANIKTMGYDDAMIRKYEYYFTSCAAAFMTDHLNMTHFVFDKFEYLDDAIIQNASSISS